MREERVEKDVTARRCNDERSQSTAREPLSCYACHNQIGARCSYCLLPVCPEHGEQVQSWFTRRHVLVCTSCQAKLQEIAQEEESLSWAAVNHGCKGALGHFP